MMTVDDLIPAIYATAESLAEAYGCGVRTITNWRRTRIPDAAQYKLQVMTGLLAVPVGITRGAPVGRPRNRYPLPEALRVAMAERRYYGG